MKLKYRFRLRRRLRKRLGVLVLAAMAACFVLARRVTAVDPMIALRDH